MCEIKRIRSILACWSVVSICAFIGMGIAVVRPYYRAEQMIPTECTTVAFTQGMGAVTCDCGKNCGRTCQVSCTFVQVSYDSPINGTRRFGKLSYGEHDLDTECYRSYSIKCKECSSTRYEHRPPPGTFNCWIDSENDKVLEIRLYNTMSVFHAIVWPVLSLILSLCAWAIYFTRCT